MVGFFGQLRSMCKRKRIVKKSSGIISFLVVSMMSLHAMELIDLTEVSLIDDYGSLTKDTCDIIQQQTQTFLNPVFINPAGAYLDAIQSSLKLDQLSRSFCALSEKSKREVMRTMSLQLMYLHAITLCFPPEIVKDHIILSLLDGNTNATEQFYTMPFVQAFDLYHEIKTGLSDDRQPVGDLYAESKQVRDLVLKLQKTPWYYSQPIIDFEDNEEIGLLSGDIKNRYLGGKKILVLPDNAHNKCTPKKLCAYGWMFGGIGLGMFGCLEAIFAIVGAVAGSGAAFACHPMSLLASGSFSVTSTLIPFCYSNVRDGCNSLHRHSQEITI